MNGALAELRATRRLGERGVQLIYRTIDAVARSDRLPPPAGHARWDAEAVAEVAHQFVAEHLLGKRRIDTLLLRATDEGSFRRLLEATVRNFFRDEYRRTARGALGRRFGDLLDGDPRFRLWVPGRTRYGSDSLWGLSRWTDPGRFEGLPASLVQAAWRIPGITVVRWREDAARRSPLADADSLVRFLEGVLDAAEGLMSVPDLVEVASYRFAVRDAPAVVSLEEPTPPAIPERAPGPEELTLARAKAAHVYAQLSDRERKVLLRMGDQDVRAMGEELGLPKSTTFDAVQRVRNIVTAALEPSDDPAAVLRELEFMVVEGLA